MKVIMSLIIIVSIYKVCMTCYILFVEYQCYFSENKKFFPFVNKEA